MHSHGQINYFIYLHSIYIILWAEKKFWQNLKPNTFGEIADPSKGNKILARVNPASKQAAKPILYLILVTFEPESGSSLMDQWNKLGISPKGMNGRTVQRRSSVPFSTIQTIPDDSTWCGWLDRHRSQILIYTLLKKSDGLSGKKSIGPSHMFSLSPSLQLLSFLVLSVSIFPTSSFINISPIMFLHILSLYEPGNYPH